MEKIHKYSQIIAIALGVLTPCILLAGYVYYLGYISAFGLDHTLMNRGFGDVITESWYIGLLVLVFLLAKWWYPVVFVLVVTIIATVAMYVLVRINAKGVEIFSQKITKQNQGRTVLGFTQWHWICLGGMISEMGSVALAGLGILAFAGVVIIFPYQHGNKEAKRHIDLFRDNGCEDVKQDAAAPSRCIYLVDISSPSVPVAQGILVSANKERVAIFNGEVLEVWPLLDTYKLQRKYFYGVELAE